MFSLHELAQIKRKRKRVGRGGSRGGTSGKGHKGQRARSGGKVPTAFEGGQMPLIRRLPKRGFNNKRFKKAVAIVSLNDLNRFDEGTQVTREVLLEAGVINCPAKTSIKLLASGALEKKLVVHVDACSAAAAQAVAERGGEVHITQER